MGLTHLALLNVYSPESFSELIYCKQLSLYDTVSNGGNNNGNVQYRSEISEQRRCRHKRNLRFTRIFSFSINRRVFSCASCLLLCIALFCKSSRQKVQNLYIENVNERVSDFFLPSQDITNKQAN